MCEFLGAIERPRDFQERICDAFIEPVIQGKARKTIHLLVVRTSTLVPIQAHELINLLIGGIFGIWACFPKPRQHIDNLIRVDRHGFSSEP